MVYCWRNLRLSGYYSSSERLPPWGRSDCGSISADSVVAKTYLSSSLALPAVPVVLIVLDGCLSAPSSPSWIIIVAHLIAHLDDPRLASGLCLVRCGAMIPGRHVGHVHTDGLP